MMTDTLDEGRMAKIRKLEHVPKIEREEEAVTYRKPVFTTALQRWDDPITGATPVFLACPTEVLNLNWNSEFVKRKFEIVVWIFWIWKRTFDVLPRLLHNDDG